MQTMHPTLLIGPADWSAARMPRADYEARIEALFTNGEKASGAIVYGNSLDHAALCYLTGFTPKLEAALTLIPRSGEPQLLVGGGVNMIAAARPLTWVEHLSPLRNAGQTVAEWARDLPTGGRLLTIGGDAMPFGMRQAIDQALGDLVAEDGTALLHGQMLRKAPRELAALREACVGLETAATALRAAQGIGAGATDTMLAAELAALRWGAQDVRSQPRWRSHLTAVRRPGREGGRADAGLSRRASCRLLGRGLRASRAWVRPIACQGGGYPAYDDRGGQARRDQP